MHIVQNLFLNNFNPSYMKKICFFVVILCSIFVIDSTAQVKKKYTDSELFKNGHVMTAEEKRIADLPYIQGTRPCLYMIETTDKETKVTFLQSLYFDSQWIHYSRGFKIVDLDRGDQYLVRGYDGTLPMGRVITVRGLNRKMIYITLVFPPLRRGIKNIDIIEEQVEDDPSPSNSAGPSYPYRVKVSDYTPKAIAKQAKNRRNCYK